MPRADPDTLDTIESPSFPTQSNNSPIPGRTLSPASKFQGLKLDLADKHSGACGPLHPTLKMGGPPTPGWGPSPWGQYLWTLGFNQVCLGQEKTLRSSAGFHGDRVASFPTKQGLVYSDHRSPQRARLSRSEFLLFLSTHCLGAHVLQGVLRIGKKDRCSDPFRDRAQQ